MTIKYIHVYMALPLFRIPGPRGHEFHNLCRGYLSIIIMHSDSLHGGEEYRRSNAFLLYDQYSYTLKQEPLPRVSRNLQFG